MDMVLRAKDAAAVVVLISMLEMETSSITFKAQTGVQAMEAQMSRMRGSRMPLADRKSW